MCSRRRSRLFMGGKAKGTPVLSTFSAAVSACRRSSCGAHGLEVVGVKADQVALALVETQHLRGDGFQSAQQLAVVLRDQRHVRPGQLDVDLAALKALGVAGAVTGGDAVLEAHSTQLVQGGEKSGNFLGSFLQICNWHN